MLCGYMPNSSYFGLGLGPVSSGLGLSRGLKNFRSCLYITGFMSCFRQVGVLTEVAAHAHGAVQTGQEPGSDSAVETAGRAAAGQGSRDADRAR